MNNTTVSEFRVIAFCKKKQNKTKQKQKQIKTKISEKMKEVDLGKIRARTLVSRENRIACDQFLNSTAAGRAFLRPHEDLGRVEKGLPGIRPFEDLSG